MIEAVVQPLSRSKPTDAAEECDDLKLLERLLGFDEDRDAVRQLGVFGEDQVVRDKLQLLNALMVAEDTKQVVRHDREGWCSKINAVVRAVHTVLPLRREQDLNIIEYYYHNLKMLE